MDDSREHRKRGDAHRCPQEQHRFVHPRSFRKQFGVMKEVIGEQRPSTNGTAMPASEPRPSSLNFCESSQCGTPSPQRTCREQAPIAKQETDTLGCLASVASDPKGTMLLAVQAVAVQTAMGRATPSDHLRHDLWLSDVFGDLSDHSANQQMIAS